MAKAYKYISISEKLIEYMKSNGIMPGCKLPGLRVLSKHFNVSKNTIVNALSHLSNEGIVESREKTGTYATERLWFESTTLIYNNDDNDCISPSDKEFKVHYNSIAPHKITLGTAMLSPEFDADKYLKLAIKDVAETDKPIGNIFSKNSSYEAMSSYLQKKGINARPHNLFFTTSINNSLNHLVRAYLKRGMYLLIEEISGINMFVSKYAHEIGVKVVHIKMDSGGIIPHELKNPKYSRKSMLVLSSVHQYPTGITMSRQRMQEIYKICKSMQIQLVELDYFSDLFDTPSLKTLDTDNSVVYCGSFKNCFALGLNIAWVLVPDYLKNRLALMKMKESIYKDIVTHSIVEALIKNGHYYRFLEEFRTKINDRVELTKQLLCDNLGDSVSFVPDNCGTLFWLNFHKDVRRIFEPLNNFVISQGMLFSEDCRDYISFCPFSLTEPELRSVMIKISNSLKCP